MASQPDYRAEFNPFHVEGDTFGPFRIKHRLTDDPTYEDLSGCTFKANLIQGDDVVLECNTANGRIDLEDSETIIWTADSSDAAVLVAGKYKYDIEYTYNDGTVRTRIFGTLTVKKDRSE